MRLTSRLGEDAIFDDLPKAIGTWSNASYQGACILTDCGEVVIPWDLGKIVITSSGELTMRGCTLPVSGKFLGVRNLNYIRQNEKYSEPLFTGKSRSTFPTTPGLYYCSRQDEPSQWKVYIFIPEEKDLSILYLRMPTSDREDYGVLETLIGSYWPGQWAFHQVLSGIKFLVTI